MDYAEEGRTLRGNLKGMQQWMREREGTLKDEQVDLFFIGFYGVDLDFFNILPLCPVNCTSADWEWYLNYAATDKYVKTYSELYKKNQEKYAAADPKIVNTLDTLVLELRDAAKRKDIDKLKQTVEEISAYKKD